MIAKKRFYSLLFSFLLAFSCPLKATKVSLVSSVEGIKESKPIRLGLVFELRAGEKVQALEAIPAERNKMKFCCEEMDFHAREREKIIAYGANYKLFGIRANGLAPQEILYCPWCGTKLPNDHSSSSHQWHKDSMKPATEKYRGAIKGRNIRSMFLEDQEEAIKKTEFCCEKMALHTKGRERIIDYVPSFRGFSIRIKEPVAQAIQYCPWCGSKLPKDLGDELCAIVFDELNMDNFQDPRLPEEFKSDEWWKKRGL